MWAITRSSAASAVLVALLASPFAPAAHARSPAAPSLPAEVVRVLPDLSLKGGGELRFFGLSVYDGWLWTSGVPFESAFALDLHYHRALDGAKIAQRSADEIAKLGLGTAEERRNWLAWMARWFPDVRKGDRLTGLYLPARGARFFHNGRALAEIDDPAFARAFFAIWLDPQTSRPDFRERLLGTP